MKKVALLIETSREYGRGLLRGIAQYVQTNEGWATMHHAERLLGDGIPDWFLRLSFDGVLIRSESEEAMRAVRKRGLPFVDLRAAPFSLGYAIDTDDRKVAEMACLHLLERGYKQLGFCGFQGASFSDRRLAFTKEFLLGKGVDLFTYESICLRGLQGTSDRESFGIVDEPGLIKWLSDLPKPLGIFACNDARGHQVIQACRNAKLRVPEDFSVIGVDNDRTVCGLSSPPLSSISHNTMQIGRKAAEMLDKLMGNQDIAQKGVHYVCPDKVITRRSSDISVIDDAEVSKALAFISEHACEGIGVDEVVNSLPLSRAALERRFRKVMPRSIGEEIRRVRIDRVKSLLTETDLKLGVIAKMAGYGTAEYLATAFKKETGASPSTYRSTRRQRTIICPRGIQTQSAMVNKAITE